MAAAAPVFDAQIRAVDGARNVIKAIAGQVNMLRAAIGAAGKASEHAAPAARAVEKAAHGVGRASHAGASGAEHMKKEVEEAGKASEAAMPKHIRFFAALTGHVRLLRGHLGELNANIGEVTHSLGEFLPMLGALGAGASLVGLFELTNHTAEMRGEFLATAQKIGILPAELGRLNMAAKMTDVSVESMHVGLGKLDMAIATAAAGKNKEAAGLFQHLGISLKGANGHLKTVNELMPALADAFQHTADPAMRVRAAMALFGKAGKEMIPMLIGGSEALREYAAAADEVRPPVTKEQGEALEAFHRGWINLNAAVSSFSTSLGAKLAPVLEPVVAKAYEFVNLIREPLANVISAEVAQLAEWFKKLNLPQVVEHISSIAQASWGWIEAFGGVKTIVGAVVLAMGSPLLIAVTAAIGIFTSFAGILRGLAVVVWANPILLAIAAVAAAAYLIYKYWDPIKAYFTKWWDGVTADFKGAGEKLSQLPPAIIAAWKPIGDFFNNLWNGVTDAFNAALARIMPIVDKIKGAASWVSGSWLGRQFGGGKPPGDASTPPPNLPPSPPSTVTLPPGIVMAPTIAVPSSLPQNPFVPAPGRDAAPPLPSLYRPDSPAAAPAAPQEGRVKVDVNLQGLPAGSSTRSTATGIADIGETSVGMINPMAAY